MLFQFGVHCFILNAKSVMRYDNYVNLAPQPA
jgi:hypothetical protein